MKTETKHTPGSWRLHDMERATIVAGTPGKEVTNCLNGFGNQRANASLIAAAPEMLEVLKLLVDRNMTWLNGVMDYSGITYEDVKNARAVIAKAEGK